VVVCLLGPTHACVREPRDEHSTALRSPGDNGFRIQVSGEPERYVPGAVYTCESSVHAGSIVYFIPENFLFSETVFSS
jgi:hypothetical protein